jgi:hypothetical protein
MWSVYDEAGLFVITTNSVIKNNKALVMGAGIAKQTRDRFPGIDKAIGQRILQICKAGGIYGLIVSDRWPAGKIAAFQTKTNYSDPASLSLIKQSTEMLAEWCRNNPNQQVHINFPGIGNGGLHRTTVLPIIQTLPNNVTVWEAR